MGDYESGDQRCSPDPVKDLEVTCLGLGSMLLPENQWGYHKDWSLSYVKTPFGSTGTHSACRFNGRKHGCELRTASRR